MMNWRIWAKSSHRKPGRPQICLSQGLAGSKCGDGIPISGSARTGLPLDVSAIFIISYPVIISSHLLFFYFSILSIVYFLFSTFFSLFLSISLFFNFFSFSSPPTTMFHHYPILLFLFSSCIFAPCLFSASLILSATSPIHVHYTHRGPHLGWGPEYIFPPNGWNYFLLTPSNESNPNPTFHQQATKCSLLVHSSNRNLFISINISNRHDQERADS